MDGSGPDSLEKHRLRLEESLEKLRKALKHWQVYSAEYEGLQEELLALPEDADRQTMLGIAKDFGGTVVTEKEIISFLGDKEGIKRTPKQVADAVRHRIEYVQTNATQVQKQLDQGENKLGTLKVISKPDQVMNEEGLPIMDIREELDEDGNVITTGTATGPKAVPMSLGDIKGFEKFGKDSEKEIVEIESDEEGKTEEETKPSPPPKTIGPKSVLKKRTASTVPTPTPILKKPSQPKVENDVSADDVPAPGRIKVVDDAPNEFASAPYVNESEEDAKLRQEMIKYNLGEVGAIVAELELEEADDDDYDDEDWQDEEEEDDDDDEDEEEDEYGRSTKKFITDDLRAEMEALQKRLLGDGNAKRMEAVKIANEKEAEERRQTEEKAAKEKKPPKKGVRFAEALDISHAAPVPPPVGGAESPINPGILDMVFGAGTKDADARLYKPPPEPPKPKGSSLFKKSRQQAGAAGAVDGHNITENKPISGNRPPMGDIMERPPASASKHIEESKDIIDEDSTNKPMLSDTIMERPLTQTKKKPAAPSLDADELDPELHMQEVAMEHFQMRNRLIQRQGGFIERDEEKAIVPLDENGEPLKISRFKAARVRNEL